VEKEMNIPTEDELRSLAYLKYSYPRIAAKYDRSVRWIKDHIAQWPDIEEQVKENGKIRSEAQRLFGCYRAGVS
jgi:hypothetical protein